MRKVLARLSVVALLAMPTVARADGLVYKLPDDGTSVTFELAIKGGPEGMQRDMKGTLRMSSVGTEMVGDDKCRWIEFKIDVDQDGQQLTIISKSLVPEKHLGKGKSAGENILRGWLKFSEQEPMEVKDLKIEQTGPLASFLAGPAAGAMKLEPIAVENAKLGKQECAGEIASYEFPQGEHTVESIWEHRFSEKAPFGILATKLKYSIKAGGVVRDSGEVTFTLADVGTTALTELPNNR